MNRIGPGIWIALVAVALSGACAKRRDTQSQVAPDTCRQGFVWREANLMDHVCVTPETRQQVAIDNREAEARREPSEEACLPGYVWREAFDKDHVCVIPLIRELTKVDNRRAGWRLVPRQ